MSDTGLNELCSKAQTQIRIILNRDSCKAALVEYKNQSSESGNEHNRSPFGNQVLFPALNE